MMEIHSTIQFRLILPHIPGFQQVPIPATAFSVGARTGPACGHG